ncbi:MAG: DUF2973 domain-containing protein [Cyanobacteria bacterium]|jgi:hypothetical protein|nr:DUF2973 domain-containing protein [Cyanobacteriota bacterium]
MNVSSHSLVLLERVFPLLYAGCFLFLLWQAFQVMGRGFQAIPRPGDSGTNAKPVGDRPADRTGKVTIHPELLDAQGRITREDLLTVRFSGDNGEPATPVDPS